MNRFRVTLIALVLVIAGALLLPNLPANAETLPHSPEHNKTGFWEEYLPAEMCLKFEDPGTPYTVPAYEGWTVVGVILKAGSGDDANEVFHGDQSGAVLSHPTGKDISHAIVCKDRRVEPDPTPTPTVMPSEEPTPSETPTPEPSITPSEGPTETPTPSRTPTPEPSVTPSEDPTSTPTPSDTPEPSQTPSEAPEPSESPTPLPSRTPSEVPTPTNSPLPTPTGLVPADECALGDSFESRMCETARDFPLPTQEWSASSTRYVAPASKPGLPSTGN